MADCAYCDDKVAMPFKCKLCLLQYCTRHRLPENHVCPYLDTYNTDEYRKHKVALREEVQSHGAEPDDSWSSSMGKYSSGTQSALLSGGLDYWTSGSKRLDMVILAIIVGFRTVWLLFSIRNVTVINFLFTFTVSFLFATFAFMLVLYFREYFSRKYLVSNAFYFSKLFVLITVVMSIISAVFNSMFLALFFPGVFVMLSASNIKGSYKMAVSSTFTFLGVWALFRLVVPYLIFLLGIGNFILYYPSFVISSHYTGIIFPTYYISQRILMNISVSVSFTVLYISIFTLFQEYRSILFWNKKMLYLIAVLYIMAFVI